MVALAVLCSCKSEVPLKVPEVTFGIHEIVSRSGVPSAILDTLAKMGVRFKEEDPQSVIGFISPNDSLIFQVIPEDEAIMLVKELQPADTEYNLFRLVAVKRIPAIGTSDIRKTKAAGKSVEIYFNFEGTRKWAEMTEKNIGKPVAFIIDNQIYTMPLIAGEIRSGVALINGLQNDSTAINLSMALNTGIAK